MTAPTTNPSQRYEITEEQVQIIYHLFHIPDHAMDDADYMMQDEILVAIRSRPLPATPDCIEAITPEGAVIIQAAKAQVRADAEQTDNILSVLKKRYRNEMAILDYVEMIECEVRFLRQPKENTGSTGDEKS